ncbi:MAG: alkaline serine protease, subtilase family, partial [Chthonomonadales bacterium]|nr:alkaline serine protease, subtilase family [Chthonomonadales bacterium]
MHPSCLRSSYYAQPKKLVCSFLSLTHLVLLALGIACFTTPSYAQQPIQMPGVPVPAVVPNEVIVGVFTAQDDAQEAARLNTIGATVVGRQPELHAYRMRLPAGMTIATAITRFKQRADVSYAEPNHLYHIASTPNDTSYANQYGPQKVQANLAWDIWNPITPVVIAIVDTGIDGTHPDLTNKMYRDGSGAIIGYNALTSTIGNASDDFGHGTHCAGIAAAQINNGVGIAGIAGWTGGATDTTYTKLMPVKVLDSNGNGSDTTVGSGIVWAADHGAKIISMSLGGTDTS